jgi:hypothetical protein
MNCIFPITKPIGNDANVIINALNSRAAQLKSDIDTQSLLKKTIMVALKAIGFASTAAALASIPVTIYLFSATPLTIGVIALTLSISCLALHMLLDPKSPRELIIRDQWKSVFQSLRKGNGKEILATCQELAKQKEKRLPAFSQCLGALNPNETLPFFHKTCLTGYLQIALAHLKVHEDDQALSNAHLALSHFGASGFPNEIKKFLEKIVESPEQMRLLITAHQAGNDLHALDHLITNFGEQHVPKT